MKISIAQLQASESKEENLEKANEYIKKAKLEGSDIVVFPEIYMVFVPASSSKNLADVAETLDGNFVTQMAQIAKEQSINVIFGMYETKPGEQKRAYNTVVFLNRSGEMKYHYRKTHLYDAFITKESNRVIPYENKAQVIETDVGKIGILICYELRFPEIARNLVLDGAEALIVPTAWVKGPMKETHWQTLLQARAIENTVYVVGANQVDNIFTGFSLIYDPMGIQLANAGEEESLVSANVNNERTERVRNKLPVLENRVPKLY